MNRRRLLAVTFLTATLAVVLGIIVYVERLNATQTVSVFILRQTVPAGAPYTDDSVQAVPLRAGDGDFAFERRGPADLHARFATTLHLGDILRSDDLVPYDEQVEIALTVSGGPPIAPGDAVDVYASVGGSSILIGRGLRVTAGGATPTLLVPARDEAAWVAVSASATPFHAIRSPGGAEPANRSITTDEALHLLCGPPCSTLSGSRAP